MAKVIPILPCVNIDEQCAFYEHMGFETVSKYKSPNAYAVIQYDGIMLHFWGSKKNDPETNASMVFIEVDDASALNEVFVDNFKNANGKIPRAGIPRITKIRELKEDKRFTVCDPAGNTLYFGTPNDGTAVKRRALDNERHAKKFAAVYDLLHSHENPEKAAKAMMEFMRYKDELNEQDREKLAELVCEIEEAMTEVTKAGGYLN